jgi:hypothetical protein
MRVDWSHLWHNWETIRQEVREISTMPIIKDGKKVGERQKFALGRVRRCRCTPEEQFSFFWTDSGDPSFPCLLSSFEKIAMFKQKGKTDES